MATVPFLYPSFADSVSGFARPRQWPGLLRCRQGAALDHEAADDAVENNAVVETLAREGDEVLNGLRRVGIVGAEHDVAQVRRDGDFVFVVHGGWYDGCFSICRNRR
jgi:hypothetical protein